MVVRISIGTGKPTPPGLGTAEKNSGSVMQPECVCPGVHSCPPCHLSRPTATCGREMDEEEIALIADTAFQLLSGEYFQFPRSLKIKVSRESQRPGLGSDHSLKSFTDHLRIFLIDTFNGCCPGLRVLRWVLYRRNL